MEFQQAPPTLNNQYEDDRVLRSYLARVFPADILREIEPSLSELGRLARNELYHLQVADRERTQTGAMERHGNRIDKIELTPLRQHKGYQYAHNVRSDCKVIQEFVGHFGPSRFIRECTETDLREFYQYFVSSTLKKNSAGVFISRIQGMLKATKSKSRLNQLASPNTEKSIAPPEFEHRVVELTEYGTLVHTLLNPPPVPSRSSEGNKLWRNAADVVQLLRLT